MGEVLFVSKPVAPPWNDSSKNLVRDVAGHLKRHSATLMVRQGEENPLGIGRAEPLYPGSVSRGFSPGLRDNWPVFRRLIFGRAADVWHFFFAPNPRTSAAARLASSVRRVPTVHTVCSAPCEGASLRRALFADVTVALSKSTYERLRREDGSRVLRIIPPCVPVLDEPSEEQWAALRRAQGLSTDAPVLIYPGDLEFGVGAVVALQALAAWSRRDAILLMACRRKTPRADEELRRLRQQAQQWGIESRVRWVGETRDIHDFVALSDFVLLVSDSPYAKMDYPLVALESMSLGRPVLVGEGTPAAELAEYGAQSVAADGDAVARALEHLSTSEHARVAMTRNARSSVSARFSPKRVAAEYEMLYDEVCG